MRVRGTLRRGWSSTVVVALLVAIVSGAVLTLVAGARRTSRAPDAYTAFVGGDADASIQQPGGPPRTAEVAKLPGVASVQALTFLFAGLTTSDGKDASDAIAFAGNVPYSARVVAGRAADPANRHEFVADASFVAGAHARVGDRFHVVTWSAAQVEKGEGFNAAPAGPAFESTLVGVIHSPDQLQDPYAVVVLSPALLDQPVGLGETLMAVRLQPGVTLATFRSRLDARPGGAALSLDPGRAVSNEIRNAVSAQAIATWLMALVLGVAALVALGQLLTRHVRLSEAERGPLVAIGFTRRQLVAESLTRAAAPVLAGIVLGAGAAVATSGVFPAGFVRILEPHPGIHVDAVTLGVASLALIGALLAWVAIALVVAARARRVRSSPSATSEAIARRAPGAAAATGARFALTSADGSNRSPRGTVAALALITAGLVAATAFAVSLDRLVSDRGRIGSNYSFAVGDNSDLTAPDLHAALDADRDIAGMMILTATTVRVGRTTIGLVGVEHARGDLAPRLLSGREPAGPDEIALGRLAARGLHVRVGDEVELAGAEGKDTYRVVGIVVVPTIGAVDGVGQGGVVTATGLSRLDPEPGTTMAAIQLRAGAGAAARARIGQRAGFEPGLEDEPAAIINVARVRRIPGIVAALLGALALLTTAHTLLTSIQNRRRDVAILRAMGADRRWVGRVVHWQATLLVTIAIVIGVPLGLVAGSVAFRAFVDRIGAVPDPAIPIVLVLLVVAGLIAVANVVAVVPARRARGAAPATVLAAE